jgi:hypothetical protein
MDSFLGSEKRYAAAKMRVMDVLDDLLLLVRPLSSRRWSVRSLWVKALTALVLVDALGWAVGVLLTLNHVFSHRTLPTLAGIRLLSGPFEALGIDAMLVAGLLFVVVSALKLLAAYWIWSLRKDGVVLQLILLALSAVFWYGFALPFGPPGALLQLVAVALAWSSFS